MFSSIILEGWERRWEMHGVERKELGNKGALRAECRNAESSLEAAVGRRKAGT